MNESHNNPMLSIVIPTIKYSNMLDETIESALAIKVPSFEIVVSCNPWNAEFLESKYWGNPKVTWKKIEGGRLTIDKSFNQAVTNSNGDWILMLGDDDLISPDLVEGVDLTKLSHRILLTYGLQVINLEGETIGGGNCHKANMSQSEAIETFCRWGFWHHLSLFIFSRKLWEEVGGFVPMGFPNGYYEDTVHHAKLINAATEGVLVNPKQLFTRRVSAKQASAEFYTDPRIIKCGLSKVAAELFGLSVIGLKLQKLHGDVESFLMSLKRERLRIDMYKMMDQYDSSLFTSVKHLLAARRWGLSCIDLIEIWIQFKPEGCLKRLVHRWRSIRYRFCNN